MLVNAYKITSTEIFYKCKNCYTLPKVVNSKYKKNGTILKTAKPTIHTHGNNKDFSNRIEYRGSHCSFKTNSNIEILIDDNTTKLF
jgi:hypothetical protein